MSGKNATFSSAIGRKTEPLQLGRKRTDQLKSKNMKCSHSSASLKSACNFQHGCLNTRAAMAAIALLVQSCRRCQLRRLWCQEG